MSTLNRRQLLLVSATAALSPVATGATPSLSSADLQQAFARLEHRAGGRLGVAVLDTGSGARVGHRADERFGLCSSFKLLLAAAVLQGSEAERRIAFSAADLVSHSPVVKARLGSQAQASMTAAELAEATQTTSDNAAANLLLRELFGDPAGFTAWLRRQGDRVTRIDRWEPQMNLVPPGEERDTSTPAAMAATSARLLTGNGLKPAQQQRLIAWMEATRTGSRRLRAGLPSGWRAGDKTGTGMHASMADKYNDVAIVWPGSGRAPWLIACYYEGPLKGSPDMRAEDEAVLAEVGRLVGRWKS